MKHLVMKPFGNNITVLYIRDLQQDPEEEG